MRKFGVTPITVWDVKGDRLWKRKEHERRQAIRQLSMSRYLHEERRQERLEKLKGMIQGTVERELSPPTKQVRPNSALWGSSLTTIIQRQEEPSIEHLAAGIHSLIEEVQLSSRPSSRRRLEISSKSISREVDKKTRDIDTVTEHSDDEEAEVGLEAPLSEDEEQILTEEQDPAEDVEIKRALVEPDGSYTESLRQMALTAEEELQLQDLAQAASLGVEAPSRIRELNKDVDDLQDRARLVAKTYARGHSLPAKWEMEEIQQLMRVMGVPVILAHSPFEAEGLASAMALAGTVDFVGTEDTDVLGYEATLLRNIASGNKPLEIIEGKAVRSAYGLTREQYIDFLILSGTDASSRIKGVGPVKALKLIRKFGTIEAILENDEQLRQRVDLDYQEEVDSARNLFNVLPPLPSEDEVQPRKVEEATVREYMKTVHGIVLPVPGSAGIAVTMPFPQSGIQLEKEARLAHELYLQQSMQDVE